MNRFFILCVGPETFFRIVVSLRHHKFTEFVIVALSSASNRLLHMWNECVTILTFGAFNPDSFFVFTCFGHVTPLQGQWTEAVADDGHHNCSEQVIRKTDTKMIGKREDVQMSVLYG